MASTKELRAQADRKRMQAEALDERTRAANLRNEATRAEERARSLQAKSADPAETVVAAIAFIASVLGGLYWLIG